MRRRGQILLKLGSVSLQVELCLIMTVSLCEITLVHYRAWRWYFKSRSNSPNKYPPSLSLADRLVFWTRHSTFNDRVSSAASVNCPFLVGIKLREFANRRQRSTRLGGGDAGNCWHLSSTGRFCEYDRVRYCLLFVSETLL